MRVLLVMLIALIFWGAVWYTDTFKSPEATLDPVTVTAELPMEAKLHVSSTLKEIFPQLGDKEYSGAELKAAFHKMAIDSDKVCNIIHNRYPDEKNFLTAFSPELFTGKYPKVMVNLITGCHNFFRMNDVHLHKVITKINELYSDPDRACYSVGFSQIYLLATGIKCTQVTAIDVDWRILWAHFQVMESLILKKTIDFSLLHIGWSADFSGNIRELEPHIGVGTFCYASDTAACSEAFQKFPALGIKSINLQLGYIHQVRMSSAHKLVFFYVSNALDPGYTSSAQFETFMKNIHENMHYSQKVVIIYHSGGSDKFAIYEAQRYHPDHLAVRTICHDQLTWAGAYSTSGQRYDTYLDSIVQYYPEIPECSK